MGWVISLVLLYVAVRYIPKLLQYRTGVFAIVLITQSFIVSVLNFFPIFPITQALAGTLTFLVFVIMPSFVSVMAIRGLKNKQKRPHEGLYGFTLLGSIWLLFGIIGIYYLSGQHFVPTLDTALLNIKPHPSYIFLIALMFVVGSTFLIISFFPGAPRKAHLPQMETAEI